MSDLVQPRIAKQVRALFCPHCGGNLQPPKYAQSLNLACPGCGSILDASSPTLRLIQRVELARKIKPLFPLGTKGTLRGELLESIGFQRRCIKVEGVEYCWDEYLLFNPYRGYRYLTVYQGHWNLSRTTAALPRRDAGRQREAVQWQGRTYQHFQTAQASTTYILGEFPYQVRAGDPVQVKDYICPPYLLSSEGTANDLTWSHSEYISQDEIRQAFPFTEPAPIRSGVFANQPSPYGPGAVKQIALLASAMIFLWLFALLFVLATSRNKTVFSGNFAHVETPTLPGVKPPEASFVTSIFPLDGGAGENVEIITTTDVDNDSVFFAYALINLDTGRAFNSGRSVGYWHGVDDGESWSEGGQRDTFTINRVPPGNYYLRVEPEFDDDGPSRVHQVNYQIDIKRDTGGVGWFFTVLPLLLIPPIWIAIRASVFEGRRWSESDYGGPSA